MQDPIDDLLPLANPDLKYQMASDIRNKEDIAVWLTKNCDDPAVKVRGLPSLSCHLEPKLICPRIFSRN